MSLQVKMILLAERKCPTHSYYTSLKDEEKCVKEGRRQGVGGGNNGVEIVLVRSFTKGS